MIEKTKPSFFNQLETVFKIATPIGAVIAFLIGIYHYRNTQAEEFKRTYWEKRFQVYEDVCQLSAHIANAKSLWEIDSMKHDFWILYTGKSMLVEDLHVYNALKSFGRTLDHIAYPDSMPVLQNKAHMISHACRKSLKETWEPVPVSEIKSLDE